MTQDIMDRPYNTSVGLGSMSKIKGIYHPTASCDRFNLNTLDSEIMPNLIGPLYNLQTFKRKYLCNNCVGQTQLSWGAQSLYLHFANSGYKLYSHAVTDSCEWWSVRGEEEEGGGRGWRVGR